MHIFENFQHFAKLSLNSSQTPELGTTQVCKSFFLDFVVAGANKTEHFGPNLARGQNLGKKGSKYTIYNLKNLKSLCNKLNSRIIFFSSIFLKELTPWVLFQIFTTHPNTSDGKSDMINRFFNILYP